MSTFDLLIPPSIVLGSNTFVAGWNMEDKYLETLGIFIDILNISDFNWKQTIKKWFDQLN